MRLTAPVLVLVLACSAAAEPSPGRYDVEGVSAVGSYRGSAQLRSVEGGLQLELRREEAVARGALVAETTPVGSAIAFRFEAPLEAGLAGGVAGDAPPRLLRARYLCVADRLVGRWEVVERGTVVAAGREELVRSASSAPQGRVRIAVSVDWEGREVGAANVEAMAALRDALPGVPLTHFLNAAYYTKTGADAAKVTRETRRVVLPGDEEGLHVHGWRSLFASAGVAFRERPSFWGDAYPLQPAAGDLGHEVELGAYPVDDLRKVLRRSRELLGAQGFAIGGSFRCGGWMATPPVLQAIRAEGFLVDSSATDGRWHDELGTYRLRARIPEVWPTVTAQSAPFLIATPAGPVLEMPDTCALADYVTADEMVAHIREANARLAADPTRDLFVHIGFHQETAARYASRVTETIRRVAQDPTLRVRLEILAASAAAARATLR